MLERGPCPRNPGGGSEGAVEAPFDARARALPAQSWGAARRGAVEAPFDLLARQVEIEAKPGQRDTRVASVLQRGDHRRLPRHFLDPLGARDVLPVARLLALLVSPGDGQQDEADQRRDPHDLQRHLDLGPEDSHIDASTHPRKLAFPLPDLFGASRDELALSAVARVSADGQGGY